MPVDERTAPATATATINMTTPFALFRLGAGSVIFFRLLIEPCHFCGHGVGEAIAVSVDRSGDDVDHPAPSPEY